MRKEFNFQSLDAWRSGLKAAAIALPAVILAGTTYGWQGLFAMSALTVGMTTCMRRFHDEKVRQDHMFRHFGAIMPHPPSREMAISARLSGSFDTARVGVFPTGTAEIPFSTNFQIISIYPPFAEKMSDSAMEFVIAHELSHIRTPHDVQAYFPHLSAAYVVAAATAIATGLDVSNAPQTILSATGIGLSIVTSGLNLHRDYELVHDSNALRVTGNLPAAREALQTLYALMDKPAPLGLPEPLWSSLRAPFRSHPPLETRLANLDATWEAMQREAQQKSAPIPEVA